MGALSFCVVLGLGYVRYGASVYAFLLLFLAVMFFSGVVSFPLKRVSMVIVFLLIAACIGSAVKFFTVDFADNGSGNRRQRALYEALRAFPSEEGQTLYVINAPEEIGASPNYLAAAWQIAPKVTFVNQFSGCLSSPTVIGTGASVSSEGVLEVRLPKCASFKFPNTDATIIALGVNGELRRPGVGTYRFPQARIDGYWFQDPRVPILELGTVMLVKLGDPEVAIVAYNWTDGSYRLDQRAK
jgi:hypothetical protein